MTPKIIIFDFDGTIADTTKKFIQIADLLSCKYNFQQFEISKISEFKNHTLLDLALNYFKIPWYKIPFVIINFKKLLAESADKTQLYPDIKDILKELKSKGFRLGLLTSSPTKSVEIVLEKFELSNFFEFVKTNASYYNKERNIQKMINKNQLEKSDVYYIGDEIRDLNACKKIGVHCISVSWGFSSRELLLSHNPEIILEKPSQILEYFEKAELLKR